MADLFAFAIIAEEKSFTRASVRLGLSSSALSHAIRLLEERLGTKLLNRTTRSVAPTAAGQRLLERLAPALGEIAEGVEGLAEERDRPSGVVRINANRAAAVLHVMPKLRSLREAHPGVILDLALDDRLVDIVAEGFDAGIRFGEQLAQDMIAVRIGPQVTATVVAAPEYLSGRSAIKTPGDLLAHDCLVWRSQNRGEWRQWDFVQNGRTVSVAVKPVFVTSDIGMLITAALTGSGLAYVLREQVAEYLNSGRLTEVLACHAMPRDACYLYYPDRRQMRPAMRAVIDHLRDSSD